MARHYLVCLVLLALSSSVLPEPAAAASPAPAPAAAPAPAPAPAAEPRADDADSTSEEPPEGYYAFVESPNATPPRVRPPPYRQIPADCPEAAETRPHVTAHNLCGDLNRGTIPRNPMGQNPNGEPYPFELIRNQTLRFLSRTLPVLRADDTLPRVAHLQHAHRAQHVQHAQHAQYEYAPQVVRTNNAQIYTEDNGLEERAKRSLSAEGGEGAGGGAGGGGGAPAPRESRKFCDGGGVFCMLYRAINGDSNSSPAGLERRDDPGTHAPLPRYEGPPTPCPARVEYATPVFARNYQGVWRYVVQIPYEGYFTQTVEVTRCMQSRCHYLDGGCLSSPRWVSLLVAELHYPPAPAPAPAPDPSRPPLNDFQEYQQYLHKRAGEPPAAAAPAPAHAPGSPSDARHATHCDGHDELGCFQVRLYYDWFLVPGSCKCWRPDYFARYVRRRHADADL